MGYESRLYVVEKRDMNIDGKKFGELIAAFNLCCIGDAVSEFRKYAETNIRFLGMDNHRWIEKDEYRNGLNEVPLDDAINILDRAEKENDYRRFLPCLSFLRSIDKNRWDELVVLHYGY